MIRQKPCPPPYWRDCLGPTVLAVIIRSIRLNSVSLSADELFTAFWSRFDLHFILGTGAHIETIPPQYYLLMHGWTDLFGTAPWSLRLPSLLFSTACVPIVYAAGYRLFDRKTALIAAFFAAINPFMVMYAQDARPYAMLEFLCGLCYLAIAIYLQRRNAGFHRQRKTLALFAIAAAAAPFVQFTAFNFVGACGLTLALAMLIDRSPGWRELLLWAGIAGFLAVCGIEPFLLAVSQAGLRDIGWIPPVSGKSLGLFFYSILLDPKVQLNNWRSLPGCLPILVLMIFVVRMRLNRNQLLLLAILPLIYIASVVLVSLFLSILIPRIAIWLTIPLCIGFARALAVQPSNGRRGLVLLSVLILWLIPLQNYLRHPEIESWKNAAAMIADTPACDGPIVFGVIYGIGLVYYQPALAPRMRFATPIWESGQGLVAASHTFGSSAEVLEQRVIDAPIVQFGQIPQLIRQSRHMVVVLPFGWQRITGDFPPPVKQRTLTGGLHVACY